MASFPTPKDILKQYWGYGAFRARQEEIIRSAVSGRDVMVIMPTGGGKSLCYQVTGLSRDGVCIVISPLIALMKDQVDQLNKRGIRADAVHSGLMHSEIDHILDNAVYGNTKFLYVSPERLETELFTERLKKMKVALVAIDEAHCVSQWGYDFRPSYLNISKLRPLLPGVPFMALTASATGEVSDDIIDKLELEAEIFRHSFLRSNLSFVCRKVENKSAKLLEVLGNLGGSGIIYARTRKNTARVAAYLREHGYSADHYHGGLDSEERSRKQEAWMKGEVPLMVCTNAFGMGIDKSNVRFVIHWDVPDSLEAYYQEAGRAGRDGKMSYAVLLYSPADLGRLKAGIEKSYPPLSDVRAVYHALCNYCQVAFNSGYMQSFDFDLMRFAKTFRLDMVKAWSIIQMLEKEGYWLTSDSVQLPSRLRFTISKPDLYKFQVEHARWDKLIQAILRTYGGIIDHYTPVSEVYLAERTGMPEQKLKRELKTLTSKGILNYIPYKQNPTITFLRNRLQDRSVTINREFWATRKKVAAAKVSAVLRYCTDDVTCRQRMICAYFGDELGDDCGKCDYCIGQKASPFDEQEFRSIKTSLIDMLSGHGGMRIEDIEREMGFFRKRNYTLAIRRLLEEGVLRVNDKKEIIINK
jgi:ATP-dependent DNA helicase RecQ